MANSLRRPGGAKRGKTGLPSEWSTRYPKPLMAQAVHFKHDASGRQFMLSDRDRAALYLDAINTCALSHQSMLRISFGIRVTPSSEMADLTVPKEMRDEHVDILGAATRERRMFPSFIAMGTAVKVRDKLITVLEPSIDRSIGFSVAYRTVATSRQAAFEYALVLVLGQLAGDLCRCRLPSCGKFFLVEPVKIGRPRREYCSDEHREEFFRQQSPERVKRSRERAKARARKPK